MAEETQQTYFLAQDRDCHWFVVPTAYQAEWAAWCNLDDDDEASWDVPDWAESIGGGPSLVTFTGFTVKR